MDFRDQFEKTVEAALADQHTELETGPVRHYDVNDFVSLESLEIHVYVSAQDNLVEVTLLLEEDGNNLQHCSLMGGERINQFKAELSNWQEILGDNFVFEIISPNVSQILECDSGRKKMSSDVILQLGNHFGVYGLVTSTNINLAHLKNVLHTKWSHYCTPEGIRLVKRNVQKPSAPSKVRLGVIVVSRDTVVTTEDISIDLMNELCLRKRVSDMIFHKMSDKGYIFGRDAVSEDLTRIRNMFESIEMKFGTLPNQFNEEDYANLYVTPDMNQVHKIFAECWKKSRINLASTDDTDMLDVFIKNAHSGERRDHCKRAVNFPIFLASTREGVDIPDIFHSEKNNATERLIDACFSSLESSREDLNELLRRAELSYDEAKVREMESQRFNRSRPYITYEDKIELATFGICARGKAKQIHSLVQDRKKGLSYDVCLDDIDEDINKLGTWMLSENEIQQSVDVKQIKILMQKALTAYQIDIEKEMKQYDGITNTKGFYGSLILSSIGFELSTCISQKTQGYSFIVKKLRFFDIYLVIKIEHNHIFYSIVVPERSFIETGAKCCRQFCKSGSYYYTEFCSFDPSRLVNVVNLSSSFIAIVVDCCRLNDIHYTSMNKPWNIPPSSRMTKHLAFRYLVHAENKSFTEEAITNWRYVIMNLLSVHKGSSGALKAFSKHSTLHRSRLQIWVQKRQLQALKTMLLNKPIMRTQSTGTLEETAEKTENLIDYISGDYVEKLSLVVETFYFGYEVDKRNASWENADFKLVTKMLEEEWKYQEARDHLQGSKDHQDEPRQHEFSISVVRAMSDKIVKELHSELGPNWRNFIEESILTKLSSITHEEIATLKATSNLAPSDFKFDPNRKEPSIAGKTLNPVRDKMAEKVMTNLKKESDVDTRQPPYAFLPHFLTKLENEYGGILVEILKKPQHAGTREIYVLVHEARYCQLFIETIATEICRYLDYETMTKPDQKFNIPSRHYSQSKKYFKNPNADMLCSSDDKKRWNQRLVVKAFTILLCRILPKNFHPFIIRVLNLWPLKKILLPPGVQKCLRKFSSTSPTSQEVSNFLIRCFREEQYSYILNRGERILNMKTGMMTGILHCLSSLFHVAFLLLLRSLCLSLLVTNYGIKDVIISHMASSDDSASMITTVSDCRLKSRALNLMCLHVNAEFGKYVSVFDSEKSAKGLVNVMEFNSIWNICGSVVKATTKYSMCSLVLPRESSLVGRQEHFSNVLTKLLESGAPIRQCFLTQLAQCLLHYQMLGSLTNGLFNIYSDRLTELPDSNIGFFFLDHPYLTGIMSHDYNMYVAMKAFQILESKIASQLLNDDYLEFTESGSFSTTDTIGYKSLERYKDFIEECNPDFDWKQEVNSNPEMLYRPAYTVKEEMCKIMMKITSPGVANSFDNLLPIKKLASVMSMINCHSVCKRRSSLVPHGDGQEDDRVKYSLLQLSNIKFAQTTLTDQQKRWIFPSHNIFDGIEDLINKCYRNSEEKNWITTVHRSAEITIPRSDHDRYANLMILCRLRWFKHDVRLHVESTERTWQLVKRRTNWLKDTIHETLEASPFSDHCELYDYVSKVRSNKRCLHLTSPPIKGKSYESCILQLVMRDFWPRVLLVNKPDTVTQIPVHEEHIEGLLKQLQTVSCQLYLTSLLPLKQTLAEMEFNRLICSLKPCALKHFKYLSTRQASLALISMVMCEKIEVLDHDTFEDVKDIRGLVIGEYSQKRKILLEGRKRMKTGEGVWYGVIDNINVRLTIDDQTLKIIETDSPPELSIRISILKTLLDELDVTQHNTELQPAGALSYDMNTIKFEAREFKKTPVLMRDFTNFIMQSTSKLRASLDGADGIAKLQMLLHTNSSDKWVTVLNFKPNHTDFREEAISDDIPFNNLISLWQNQANISEIYFVKLLEALRAVETANWDLNKLTSPTPTEKEICEGFTPATKLWLADLVNRTLRELDLVDPVVLSTSVPTSLPDCTTMEIDNDVQPIRLPSELIDLEILSEFIDVTVTHYDEPVEREIDDTGWAHVEIRHISFGNADSSERNEMREVSRMHCLVRNLVSKSDHSLVWWKEVTNGILPIHGRHYAELIMWLLGINSIVDDASNSNSCSH